MELVLKDHKIIKFLTAFDIFISYSGRLRNDPSDFLFVVGEDFELLRNIQLKSEGASSRSGPHDKFIKKFINREEYDKLLPEMKIKYDGEIFGVTAKLAGIENFRFLQDSSGDSALTLVGDIEDLSVISLII